MARWLTVEQVADAAYAAGFRGEALVIAVAVAKGESGRGAPPGMWADAEAVGDVSLQNATWGPSVGLWQVRTVKAERGDGTTRDHDALIGNPNAQAAAAYAIVGGNTTTGSASPNRGWGHWSVWKDGLHRPYLDDARRAAEARERGGGTSSLSGGGTTAPTTGVITPDLVIPTGELLPNYRPPTSIRDLRISGSADSANVADLVIDGRIDLTAQEVSELTFTMVNEGPLRLGSGQGLLTMEAAVDWAGHLFSIAALEHSQGEGGELAVITCRDRGAQKLRKTNRNPTTGEQMGDTAYGVDVAGRELSATEYAHLQAGYAGLGIIGQGSARRANIAPVKGEDGIYESPWDVLVRLAGEEGFACFVSGAYLYFGKPTFLAEHAIDVRVGVNNAYGDRRLDAIGHPAVRQSLDDVEGATIELLLPRWRGEQVRPGMVLDVRGIYGVPQRWLVQRVSWPLDAGVEPVTVEGRQPVDPPIESPTDPEPPPAPRNPSAPSSGGGGGTASPTGGTRPSVGQAERIRLWGQPGDAARITQVTTPWGITVSVHRDLANTFLAACNAAKAASSWVPKRIDSYNKRPIRGGSEWSLHSWALAWDFFSSPPGVPPPGGVWAATSAPDAAFRNAFAAFGFRLGANYSGRKDYPHIEWVAAPPAS